MWVMHSYNWHTGADGKPLFFEAFGEENSSLRNHLYLKWRDYYKKEGSGGVMNRFWTELSSNNQRLLAEWIKKNYKGVFMAKGGRLKSALMRDRKYVSEQEWEKRYSKGKNRPRYKKKSSFEVGGITHYAIIDPKREKKFLKAIEGNKELVDLWYADTKATQSGGKKYPLTSSQYKAINQNYAVKEQVDFIEKYAKGGKTNIIHTDEWRELVHPDVNELSLGEVEEQLYDTMDSDYVDEMTTQEKYETLSEGYYYTNEEIDEMYAKGGYIVFADFGEDGTADLDFFESKSEAENFKAKIESGEIKEVSSAMGDMPTNLIENVYIETQEEFNKRYAKGGKTSKLFELVINKGGKAEDLAYELNNDRMVGEPDFEWEYYDDEVYTSCQDDDFDLLNRYAVGLAKSEGFDVKVSKFGLGGVLLGATVGGYAGYKIGRAKPQKKGFETEKKIAEKVSKKFKEKKKPAKSMAKGGSIKYDDEDYTKELETEDFIYYTDEYGERVIMKHKSDGSVASDNYFAENDLYERMVEIANGREDYIYMRPQSKQYLKEFKEDYAKGGRARDMKFLSKEKHEQDYNKYSGRKRKFATYKR